MLFSYPNLCFSKQLKAGIKNAARAEVVNGN